MGVLNFLGVRNFICFSILLCGFLSLPLAFGQQQTPEDLFNQGTAAYSKSNWPEATERMRAYIQLRPNDARAHSNLVTLYAKQNKWGSAWAHYRKALSLNPRLPGLSSLENQLEENRPGGPGLSGPFYRWVRPLVAGLEFNLLLGILLIAVTSSAHLFIRFLKKRRWAIEAEEALPPLPWTSWAFMFVSIIALLSIGMKAYLHKQSFGSVIIEQVSLVSAPTQDGFEIATLPAGVELKVLREQNSWVQVTNESGMSGWVPTSSLVIYPGASL